jgi:hypothetical protein
MTVTSNSNDTMRTQLVERLRDRITRKLVGTADRRELAASLRRIAADSCGNGAFRTRMTGASSRVKETRPELERLARRLADPDPVDARGVALTKALLSDGAGPLYWARSPESLGARLREAFGALEPRA